MAYALNGKRVYVAGHRGLLGRALVLRLAEQGCEILIAERDELDLRGQAETLAWMAAARPQAVFIAAARQGGIAAHQSRPAEMLYDNLMIAANLIEAARQTGVEKLLSVGSAAAYPVDAAQPVAESALLTGPLDPSHRAYGLAKLAGLGLCDAYRRQYGCDFITVMPINIYGPGAPFDPETSNVVPGLIRRLHEAKLAGSAEVVVWGTGQARRELIYSADCADACVHLMGAWSGEGPVNLGSGQEVCIAELAAAVAEVVGFVGRLAFDPAKPEGAARRRLDTSLLASTGWRAKTPLSEGLERTYRWWLSQVEAQTLPPLPTRAKS
jgi:GDP-L-fucose synthase